MDTLVTFTNPFDDSINSLIDFIDDIQIDHLYNSTYKLTCFIDPEINKDIQALFTKISYPYLYFCTDIKSDSLSNFIELFNNCIYQYIGIYATRFEIIYIKIDADIYVKIIPYIDLERIYLHNDSVLIFMSRYNEILKLNNVFISSDLLFDYASTILKNKSIVTEYIRFEELIYGKDITYSNKIDSVIQKLKQENYFSLIEFKDDPLFLIITELTKSFDIIQQEDYIFRYFLNPFQVSIKTWIIKSSLRILDNKLPLYRFQASNFLDRNDDKLKVKLKLAAILSYIKIKNDINLQDIEVLDDMSIQIPVLSIEMISIFNEYISEYFEILDNWSVVLCPSFLQAVSLRTITKKSKLGMFDSYIINFNNLENEHENNIDEYLIILTNKPETIKYSESIPDSEIVNSDEDRGFKLSHFESIDLSKYINISTIKDCDGKNMFIIKYNKQNLLITYKQEEVDEFKKKISNIKSEWIKFNVEKYGLMSNLILFT